MSDDAILLVAHRSGADVYEFRVLMAIAARYDDELGCASPLIAELAEDVGRSERRVQQLVQNLVNLGELAVQLQIGGGIDEPNHLRPNRYEILLGRAS